MGLYQKPTSIADLVMVLTSTLQQAEQPEAATSYVSSSTVNAIAKFLPTFTAANLALKVAEAERRSAKDAADVAHVQLTIEVRNLRMQIRRQVRQGMLPSALFTFYEIPRTGAVSYPHPQREWLALAERLLAGDDQALQAGYPGWPARATLEAATTAMRGALERMQRADSSVREVRQNRATLHSRAKRLCSDVVSELRFRLRHQPRAHMRQVLHAHGLALVERRTGTEQPTTEQTMRDAEPV
ncbi:MAG: hypothetical protein R2867_09985 [Caldilineaceae bacterium]